MRIKKESEILDPQVRARIIQDIKGAENQYRKNQAYRKYKCYKDGTKSYVVENLLNQFDITTVMEMRYSIANISIVKKIIDKLARVYSNGVTRAIQGDEEATKKLQQLEKQLCFNSAMKKDNRFLELQKNVAFYVKACPEYYSDTEFKWEIKLEPLSPFHYDVVEDYYDRTKPLVYILSNYRPNQDAWLTIDGGLLNQTGKIVTEGNRVDETIADKALDHGEGEPEKFIFWTKNYHFTCDAGGSIIQNEENPQNVNPFGVCPIVNFALDQDGAFWAEGGSDIVDGGILLNSMLTHNNHLGVVQGYGQAFMTGENLPRNVKIGPTKVILGEYKKDEQAQPTFEYLSANPQLDSLRGLVEAYVALLLTTNNLSTSGISAQLQGSTNIASGIALIIDKAESLEDVQDQRQLFLDKEPEIWEVINQIIKVYGPAMDEDLRSLELPDGFEENLLIKFNEPPSIMSEKEKLENMKLRLELGLDSMISLIMKDEPGLTEEQAEEKLKKLLEEKIKMKMMEDETRQELGAPLVEDQGMMNENNQNDNGDEGNVGNDRSVRGPKGSKTPQE